MLILSISILFLNGGCELHTTCIPNFTRFRALNTEFAPLLFAYVAHRFVVDLVDLKKTLFFGGFAPLEYELYYCQIRFFAVAYCTFNHRCQQFFKLCRIGDFAFFGVVSGQNTSGRILCRVPFVDSNS